MITVILPTYNRRAFIGAAINCFIRQTCTDWRMLVINDGGEDVADVIAELGDSRVEYFNRPHLGKAAQVNFALERVRGEYVTYMDDDDEVYPDHLEKLLAAAEKLKSDFVYSDTWRIVIDQHGRVRERGIENTDDVTRESIRVFNQINHKQILHTKALSDRVGRYDEELKILIDFDYIKRLFLAAENPFHVREITGEHFLRMQSGQVNSITGLWERDPAAAGRSLLRLFEKDPAALATLYRMVPRRDREIERLQEKLARQPLKRLEKIFKSAKAAAAAPHDALPPEGVWSSAPAAREAAAARDLKKLFALADESAAAIAAVNRIAAGQAAAADRALMSAPLTAPFASGAPRFKTAADGAGWRFTAPAGEPMRWIMLTTAAKLPRDFRLAFTYTPHAIFREQLQFDFQMQSLGERLRFMVRDNERLVFNRVAGGSFLPDARSLPFSFALDRPHRVVITVADGVAAFAVDGRTLLSLATATAPEAGYAALIFYDAAPEKPVDFSLADVSLEFRS